MKDKWIKLFSKFTEWEWYKDANTKNVFIHCLLKANWKEGRFEGQVIPRGSFVTSCQKLSEELSSKKQKISIQSIRTALKHLVSTKELTIKTTNKYTVITVNNYELYQDTNTVSNNQLTNNQQTTNNQLTTIEEYKTISSISSIEELYTRVHKFLETNFARPMSPIEIEILDSWLNYFKDEFIINYGIKIAVLNHVTTMNYLNGIYQNWKDNGYKTLEDCKPKEKEEKEKLELFEYDWFEDEEPH